jgi:hypothetical protein
MRKITCAGLLIVLLGVTGVYSASNTQIQGLIINYSETSIEVKTGRKEYLLYWTENSKVLREGQAADRAAVDICQKVKASYTVKDGRKELVTLDILKDSYCRK